LHECQLSSRRRYSSAVQMGSRHSENEPELVSLAGGWDSWSSPWRSSMLRREAGTLAYCQSFSTKLFSFLEARAGVFNERCAGDVLVWKRWQQRGWRHYPTINLQLGGGGDFWSSCVRLRFRPDTSESIYC